MSCYGWAKVTGGETYEYLKDIKLCGRVTEEGEFVLFGCAVDDETKFYQGLLGMDKATKVHGFETIEDVKKFWEEDGDMLMYIEKDCFEVINQEGE